MMDSSRLRNTEDDKDIIDDTTAILVATDQLLGYDPNENNEIRLEKRDRSPNKRRHFEARDG